MYLQYKIENHDRIDNYSYIHMYNSYFCVYKNSISILEYDANVSHL